MIGRAPKISAFVQLYSPAKARRASMGRYIDTPGVMDYAFWPNYQHDARPGWALLPRFSGAMILGGKARRDALAA